MRVRLDESTNAATAADAIPLDEPGSGDSSSAGARVSGEFRCADCGYGAVVQRTLPQCPMCSGTVWESRGPLGRR